MSQHGPRGCGNCSSDESLLALPEPAPMTRLVASRILASMGMLQAVR
ncbi:MAG TPA: hypothetical protein VN706_03005 [Gemmatimonadaceae bacterium]|nr:hypothetical protein [Gemmatimonadaceae bacterium]